MPKLQLKRTTAAVVLVIGLFSLTLSAIGRDQETKTKSGSTASSLRKKCSNETPEGTYGFYGSGTFLPDNPDGEIAGPYTTVGLIKFDGAGNFTVPAETETFNGQPVVDQSFTGTYTVNADCTLTAVNQFGGGFAGVIVDDAKEVDLMATDPGVVLNFVLKRR